MDWQTYLLPEKIPELFVDLYDGFARQSFNTYYKETAKEIVSYCPKGKILDMGCGPGYLPIQIAMLSKDIYMDGLDLSPKMIQMAKRRAKGANFQDRLQFFVNDGNTLAVKNETYDMIVSTGVFHSLKNPVKVLNECHRVLKAGGVARVYDPAQIISSKGSIFQQIRIRKFKLLLYLFLSVLVKIFKPRVSSRDELHRILQRTRFDHYTISGRGYLRIKLQK